MKQPQHHGPRSPRLGLPAAYLDPAFMACVHEAASTPELVANFDRLYGADLSRRRSPIVRMVDEATGKADDDTRGFMEFVHSSIYMTVEDSVLEALRGGSMWVRELIERA